MSERYHYTLPIQAGKKLILGKMTNSASAIECATIVDRYPGPVLLLTTDQQSLIRLNSELSQFTCHQVLTLPHGITLHYDRVATHPQIRSNRLATLYRLTSMKRGVIVMLITTLMQRVCPYDFLHNNTLLLTKGQQLSQDMVRAQLEKTGYRRVYQVMEYGEFTDSGALLDCYPMGSAEPYRITFDDDKINSILIFDVKTQRALNEVHAINLLPAYEFPTDHAALKLFCRKWRAQFDMMDEANIYQQISKGTLPIGVEYWQSLFFSDHLVPLFSYLPASTLVIKTGDIKASAMLFWAKSCAHYYALCVDHHLRPLLPPEALLLPVETLFTELKSWPCVQFSEQTLEYKADHYNMDYRSLPNLALASKNKAQQNMLLHHFNEQFDGSVIFLVKNEERRKIISALLEQFSIAPKQISRLKEAQAAGTYLMIGASERGFIDAIRRRALICEGDLLENFSYRLDNRRTIYVDNSISNLAELQEGQPVVHFEHGVGRYAGMTTLDTGGIKAEYVSIKYAGTDKLYVPISSLNLISSYASCSENAPLHKLGGAAWPRARQKAADMVHDFAAELLDIDAQRSAKIGFSCRQNQQNYQLFCATFPFEPTVDQANAINDVLNDMCQPRIMNRLVCGDVGFGKTEVAMRAAFLAIENHKQVAVLVPTTLLAQQHFDNFLARFTNWPVHIEIISRFRSSQDQYKVLEQTAAGKVDILIGTHKLLQNDVKWHDLGLLIVDEEHRFGVRDKERIKVIRSDVDILTLTATPIPRTLNMAMSGIRDLSIIATPPPRRLAVKTFVHEYDNKLVQQVILREVRRGGQVYYLYNDVDNIEKTAHRLAMLVPEARIAVGHGQMRERDLELVMNNFYHQHFNVLVCTTIIETGIDIANTNSIIIERADHFGLAQLHQLRGRVGRSHRQAYAYLLTPPLKTLSNDAKQRLEAIASLENLGAGFALATQDLEIRGAGELLGKDQSGQIATIGFSLYLELLEKAVESLKAGQEPSLEAIKSPLTEVELRLPVLLPADYIPDVNTRLSFYKRLASAAYDCTIEEIKVELIDRFGLLPEAARYMLEIAVFRLRAQRIGIRRIECSEKGGFIEFYESNLVDPNYLIGLLQSKPGTYRMDGTNRLKFLLDLAERTARLNYVDQLLKELQEHQLPS